MLQGVKLGSLYNAIPTFSNKVGMLALVNLLQEWSCWSYKEDNPSGSKSFQLGLSKAVQITNIPSTLRPLLTENTGDVLILATSLFVIPYLVYTHTVSHKVQNDRYHAMPRLIVQSFNIIAKTINSFAIGKMVHEYFCKGQKPGVLMAATTVFALGLSASNVYSDWNDSSTLPRYYR